MDGQDDNEPVTVGKFNRWLAFAVRHHVGAIQERHEEIREMAYRNHDLIQHLSQVIKEKDIFDRIAMAKLRTAILITGIVIAVMVAIFNSPTLTKIMMELIGREFR